jgi:hypothetical protein
MRFSISWFFILYSIIIFEKSAIAQSPTQSITINSSTGSIQNSLTLFNVAGALVTFDYANSHYGSGGSGVSSFNTRTGAVALTTGDVNAVGPLTLNLTGNVTGNVSGSSANFTGNLAGDVTGAQGTTTVGKINGTSLASLSTGLLYNTTATGIPSIATANQVASGLTGATGTLNLSAATVTLPSKYVAVGLTTYTPSGTTQTIDFSLTPTYVLNLGSATGAVTLTFSNAVAGGTATIIIVQGATPRGLVFPANTLQNTSAGGTTYVAAAANSTDVLAIAFIDATHALVSPSASSTAGYH